MPDPVTPNSDPNPNPNPAPEVDPTILNPPDAATSILNPDLTLSDNWFDKLPDDLRGETSLKVIKTLPDLVKRTVNAEKLIGKNKIALPTDKSKPEEWDAFYAATGRPKSPDEYKVEVPAALKELFPDDRLAASRKRAHELGISQRQYEGYMKGEIADATQLLAQREQLEQQQIEAARVKADEELRKDFGAAYDERIHVANRIVAEKFGNDKEGEMAFLAKYGNDPLFIRFASWAGAKLMEHKAIVAEYQGQSTPTEALAKIEQLRNTPGYMSYDGSYTRPDGTRAQLSEPERQHITAQIREMTKLAYPEPAARKAG